MTTKHPVRPWFVCSGDPCTCRKPAPAVPEFSGTERETLLRFALAEPAPESYAMREIDARMFSALSLIAERGCETFTVGRCWSPGNGRTRGARYGAECWCDPCVATDALGGQAPTPSSP